LNVLERRSLQALLILSLEDVFARARLAPDAHPRPFEPLQFFLTQQQAGGSVTRFDPPVPLKMSRNASGYHLFFGREKAINDPRHPGRTDPAQAGRLLRLPVGRCTLSLRITSPLYQTVEASFNLPITDANLPDGMKNYSVDLEPSYRYPFPATLTLGQVAAGDCTGNKIVARRGPTLLRGVLLDTGGNGIPDAQVQVTGRSNIYRTDGTGQWVLWFRDSQVTGPVTAHFDRVGNPPTSFDVHDVCIARGCETALHQTALRGWVRQGSRGIPGASITVTNRPGTALTGLDGGWTYAFPFSQASGQVKVQASLPDGRSQTKDVNVVSRATRIVDTFQFP
jgi:hypothetical protein